MSDFEFPPSDELVQHEPVTVALTVVKDGKSNLVLAGRTHSSHIRPAGAVIHTRPPIRRPWPARRGDEVSLRMTRRAEAPPLIAPGEVAWVRERAFMPNGMAVSFIGVAFSWNPEEMALEVAAFLAA